MSSAPVSPSDVGYKSPRIQEPTSTYDVNTPTMPRMTQSASNISAHSTDMVNLKQLATAIGSSPASSPQPRSTRAYYKEKFVRLFRKKPKTAGDVHHSLTALIKSHEKYRKDLVTAVESLQEWTETMSPQRAAAHYTNVETVTASDILLMQLADKNIFHGTGALVDTMKPIVDHERFLNEVLCAFAYSFDALKKDEADCKSLVNRYMSAEDQYCKSRSRGGLDGGQLDNERKRLVDRVDSATSRFHMTAHRELPLRFEQLAIHYDKLEKLAAEFCKSMNNLLYGKAESNQDSSLAPIESDYRFHKGYETDGVSPLSRTPEGGLNTPMSVAPLKPSGRHPGICYSPTPENAVIGDKTNTSASRNTADNDSEVKNDVLDYLPETTDLLSPTSTPDLRGPWF